MGGKAALKPGSAFYLETCIAQTDAIAGKPRSYKTRRQKKGQPKLPKMPCVLVTGKT
ncbi:hypothetical protein C4K38_1360 [Pseudomonas chlororaphis subsp. piscium]|nr:hypothetical protein C4K38_1360 [Pseudomonas chlororaphis subsp. piscium]SDT39029.1 hypothetical protein SAMN05216585_6007 [Pseudomonas chlororaphis]